MIGRARTPCATLVHIHPASYDEDVSERVPSSAHVEDTWVGPDAPKGRNAEDFPLLDNDDYDHGIEVARGGLGRIVRAYDRRLGRVVALKELISKDPKAEHRFVREAKITARLEHPNIVPIHEAGRWPNGERFYAMKMVDGMTLSDALAEASTLELRLALLPHVIDVADAVAYAHSQGILHRDLKPANVMVGAFGETVVIDWGLAKDLSEPDEDTPHEEIPASTSATETSDGIVVGTPPYMAPEQARADRLDQRSDVYALGAMLYQVLSGRRPYEEIPPKDVLRAVVQGPPVPLETLAPDMPRDLLAIVRKAMNRDSTERYPTALEMAAELRRFGTGQLVAAHRYSPVERGLRVLRRNIAPVLVGLTAMVVLLVFAAWSFNGLARRTEVAEKAQAQAELKLLELTLEKARALLNRDPTMAVAWMKQVQPPLRGTASAAAEAQDLGVAREVYAGHGQEVDLVVYDPTGRWIASGSRDETVRLWSREGLPSRVLEHRSRVSALMFGPEGRRLATGAYDGLVRVFPVSGGAPLVLTGHEAPVVALQFASPSRLVSLGRDGQLRAWALDGGGAQALLTPPVGDWGALRVLEDGRRWVTAGHGGQLLVWDVDRGEHQVLVDLGVDLTSMDMFGGRVAIGAADGTVAIVEVNGRATRTLGGHRSEIRSVRFAPDGRSLASASMDGDVFLWSLAEGEPVALSGHAERVTDLRFSADGHWLASSSWDGTAKARDLRSGEVEVFRGHAQVITTLDFSPDGRWLTTASWDTNVRLWRLRPKGTRVLKGHRIGVHAVAFSPDGRSVASGGHDDELRVWDLRTSRAQVLSGHGDNVYRVVYAPGGRVLASSSDDQTVRVWSLDTGQSKVLSGHRGDVEELSFSSDGRKLASAGRQGEVFLWALPDGLGRELEGHTRAVTGLAFVAGGRLATAGLDGQVLLWGLSGETSTPLLEGTELIRGLHASRNGRRLAAAGGDGVIWVWAMPEGRLLHRLEGFPEADLVRLSPDGAHAAIASARRGLWLCNLAYELCDPLVGHEARVFDLAFSPSGRALVSGSGDHSVRLWDVSTLESRVLRGHRAPVFDVDVSPDGAWVVSGSGDTEVRVQPLRLPPAPRRVPQFLEELTNLMVEAES